MKRLPHHVRHGAYRERGWWLEWPVRICFVIFVIGLAWKALKWIFA